MAEGKGTYVYHNPHWESYKRAEAEDFGLSAERDRLLMRLAWIDKRIAQLRECQSAIETLLQEDPGEVLAGAGLTELCREALRRMPGEEHTASDVRQSLERMGIDISGYSNPYAVLHKTLERICEVSRHNIFGTVYTLRDEEAITQKDEPGEREAPPAA
ncbi:MAG: hypothetical protein C5B51_30020 [Terriglobia bacterium]|nr:MAG: hypothetical protein C5B51_30020 [Terriglobia bacterium]